VHRSPSQPRKPNQYILKGGKPLGNTGVYSGTGVSLVSGQYMFDASMVTLPLPKTVTITYSYVNMYGCPGTDTKQVQVILYPLPVRERHGTTAGYKDNTPYKLQYLSERRALLDDHES